MLRLRPDLSGHCSLRLQRSICWERYIKFRTIPLRNEVLKANLYPIIISQMEANHV
jgi:hypothetical protein